MKIGVNNWEGKSTKNLPKPACQDGMHQCGSILLENRAQDAPKTRQDSLRWFQDVPKTPHSRLQEAPRRSQDGHHSPQTASEKALASYKMASGRFPEPAWKHLERVLELETCKSRPETLQASIVVSLGLDFEGYWHILN